MSFVLVEPGFLNQIAGGMEKGMLWSYPVLILFQEFLRDCIETNI